MADPLSITASVIAVLQLTGTVITLGKDYIKGVKDAPEDIQQLIDELRSLGKVLSTLRDHVVNDKDLKSTALQALNGQNGHLSACALELKRLQLKLKPGKGLRAKINRLKWPLKEKETFQYISRIERHKSLFTFALTIDQLNLSKAIEANTTDTNHVVHTLQTELVSSAQTARRKDVLNWLYPDNFDTKHIEISSRRQSNTGEWIFQEPEFIDWAAQRSKLLWGYGIPGAGKTFLSSLVIDRFRDQASAANYGVAYIYFDYMDRDRQRPINILSSLVRQLIDQTSHIPTEVEQLYNTLTGTKGKRNPTFEEIYTALLVTSKKFGQVFLMFDALDECDPNNQRNELLSMFHRLKNNGISVFLTSRPHPEDIQSSLNNAAKIQLSAKEADIGAYVQQRIDESPRAKRLVGQGKCKDTIVSTLVDCAKGMFLFVHFHVEYLCQQTTVREILTEIENLKNASTDETPLDPTYDRAIETLRKQSKNSINLALNVLSWLVNARRILTIDELRHAVSVKPNQVELDDLDLPDKTTLLDVCASLVTIDENSNTIRLAHYTVQEYLLRRNILPDAAFRLAMACTTYLAFDTFGQGACMSLELIKNRFRSYPFLGYAAGHLHIHIMTCDEALTKDVFLTLLGNAGNMECYFQSRWHHDSTYFWDFTRFKRQPALHLASSIGHYLVVYEMLKKGVDISAQDEEKWTALHWAASKGHETIAQLLLEKGADPSVQNEDGWTALHQAAYGGQKSTVKLLLGNGADSLVQDKYGQTTLYGAAYRGQKSIVQLLLENGADPSVQNRDGETALHWAASKGHETIAQLLLEKGADPSVQDKYGWTALHKAASGGHQAIVQLLLEKGVDSSVQGCGGWTALHNAASGGHQAVVQLLLENRVDPSVRTDDGWTALHKAASGGHQAIVQLLFEKRVDHSVQDNDGWTALHHAVSEGHKTVIQLLLEKGADPSVKSSRGWTTLLWAVYRGHETVIQLLLEKGADPSVRANSGWTALHQAAYKGHETVVQLLLEKGADPSVQANSGRTALHLAASKGHGAVVQLLFEKGADLSVQNKYGWTALQQAAYKGHGAVVKLLLEKGADPSVQDKDGRIALHWAASGGHKTVVQMLLENGADHSVQGKDGWTALHQAASQGHEAVVQLLLEKGAGPSVQDKNTEKALQHVSSHNFKKVARLEVPSLQVYIKCSAEAVAATSSTLCLKCGAKRPRPNKTPAEQIDNSISPSKRPRIG